MQTTVFWTRPPLTLFVFDEADEFIPQSAADTYEVSVAAVETLARRSRKFGLGVLIATQKVTCLNTSIMAQPHTCLISKLPRIRQAEGDGCVWHHPRISCKRPSSSKRATGWLSAMMPRDSSQY